MAQEDIGAVMQHPVQQNTVRVLAALIEKLRICRTFDQWSKNPGFPDHRQTISERKELEGGADCQSLAWSTTRVGMRGLVERTNRWWASAA